MTLPQNKNGEGLPSAVTPRVQRPATTTATTTVAAPSGCSSKQPVADTEASEQRALHTVQYGLLKILSRTLAALRHFTPDVCQILLDQVLTTSSHMTPGSQQLALNLDSVVHCVVLWRASCKCQSAVFCLSVPGSRRIQLPICPKFHHSHF